MCYHHLIDVKFIGGLLQRDAIRRLIAELYLCGGDFLIGKTDLINRKYQIMIVSMLKNRSRKYFSYYIIKFEFVDFMLIYYDIN